jgi:hypothetical protein
MMLSSRLNLAKLESSSFILTHACHSIRQKSHCLEVSLNDATVPLMEKPAFQKLRSWHFAQSTDGFNSEEGEYITWLKSCKALEAKSLLTG